MEFFENFGKTFREKPVTIWVNDMLGFEYSKDRKEIDIHISDQRDKKTGEKLRLLRDGFKKLADILKHETGVELITATSWIVKEHPRLLKLLGFTLDENSKRSLSQKKEYEKRLKMGGVVLDSKKDTVPGHAFVSRDKFIELYEGDD